MTGIALVGLLCLPAACGGTDPACVISGVTISPGSGSVVEDETLNLSASVTQTNCGTISISWQSLTPSTASVAGSGPLGFGARLASGSANVVATATSGNVTASGSAGITVTPAPVATITITPPAASVQAGQTQALTAELRSARNRVLAGRTITWSSSNETFAGVADIALKVRRPVEAIVALFSDPLSLFQHSHNSFSKQRFTVRGSPFTVKGLFFRFSSTLEPRTSQPVQGLFFLRSFP